MWISWRDSPHEFIITIGTLEPNDLNLFFGQSEFPKHDDPQSRTVHIHFPDKITWEDLAVVLNQQPSKTQARKNGWIGEIPKGYTEFKRKFHKFYILNLSQEVT